MVKNDDGVVVINCYRRKRPEYQIGSDYNGGDSDY